MESHPRQRRKRHASKVMLLVSFAFHTLIVVALTYFAAREGLLGKQLKKIAVEMVKEKPPEKPKEPEKPKPEPPKIEPPKVAVAPKAEAAKPATQPLRQALPPAVSAPVAAPPSAEVPAFVFEGGKAVETTSDPVTLYKSTIEFALHSGWTRPPDVSDAALVAEVEINIDRTGMISGFDWKKKSGHQRWDESVRKAVTSAKTISRPPPTNFPSRILVRFDVQEEAEPGAQLN